MLSETNTFCGSSVSTKILVNMGTPRSPGMVLHSLVQGQGEGPSLADVPVPACLNQCINQEAFACKICGDPYDNIHALVEHGKHHLDQAHLTCAFCGDTLPSFVALTLHQVVWQPNKVCSDCGAPLNLLSKHVCHLTEGIQPGQGSFKCPLQCSKLHYPLEYLKAHLVSFHGCEKSCVEVMKDSSGQVQGVKAELGNQAVACPICNTRINSNTVKLESHVILNCSARSKSVTHRVSNLVSMAEEWAEDPLLVIKQEVDAAVLHYSSLLDGDEYLDKFLQLAMAADRRYDRLPANYSKEYLGHRIEGITLQQLKEQENNLVFKFEIWSKLVEKMSGPKDIQDLIVKFEEDMMSAARSGMTSTWCKLDKDLAVVTDPPDSKTLADLEQELGWMQAGCPRDLESSVKQLQVQMKLII